MFKYFYLPVLEGCKDGKEKKLADSVEYVIKYLNLTEEDKKEMIKSNRPKVVDRTDWARLHLKRAGLLYRSGIGCVKITTEGLRVLKLNLDLIDNKFLMQYDSFKEFSQGKNKSSKKDIKVKEELIEKNSIEDNTPEDIINQQIEVINQELADELHEQILNNSPEFFERLVMNLLNNIGYGGLDENSSSLTPHSNDKGIDGIINEDKLGLNKIYIQAKRHQNKISRPEIHSFSGALDEKKATKGVFITTSDFTTGAKEFAKNSTYNIVLIDGKKLTNLMIQYDVGVSTTQELKLKKIDTDYFIDPL